MEITESVRRATLGWVVTMRKAYGQEIGMKCFDVLRESFGEDLVSSVIFGLLKDDCPYGETITLSLDRHRGFISPQKINCIKEVRSLTGLGVKESKDIIEDVFAGRDVSITIDTTRNHVGPRDVAIANAIVVFDTSGI